ncbi:MAG: type II secretion system protein [Bacilli bacterium]|nr:type II secretion system protein [Bacilli bacterium]
MNNIYSFEKKGFTLIEILAVIVIIGIILFLAVPAVTHLIENSRRKLVITSITEYIGEIENKAMMDEESNYYGRFSVSDLTELEKSNGEKPSNGFIEIDDNEKVTRGIFCINNYKVYYDGKDANIDYNGSCDSVKSLVEVIYFNPNTGLKCDKVDSSSINGTKNGCMKWYLYSYNKNNTVDMILDHNTSNNVLWNVDGLSMEGPKTALLKLNEDTINWLGIPERADIYNFRSAEDNYSIDYTGFRARMLYVNEILPITPNDYDFSVTETHYQDSYCFENGKNLGWDCGLYDYENTDKVISNYSFLYDNTINCIKYKCEIEQDGSDGYWTSDSYNQKDDLYDGGDYVFAVLYSGGFQGVQSANIYGGVGIRPVITIPRTLID